LPTIKKAVAAKVAVRGDRFVSNAQLSEQLGRFAFGVEQTRLPGRFGRVPWGQDVDREGIFLGFARAELGGEGDLVRAALRSGGNARLTAMRSCPPAGTVSALLPVSGLGSDSDQEQSQVVAARESLITTICFWTVCPGRKLCSLVVKCAPLPAM